MTKEYLQSSRRNALANNLTNRLIRNSFSVCPTPLKRVFRKRVENESLVERQDAVLTGVQFLVRASIRKVTREGARWQITAHSLIGTCKP